MSDLHEIGRAAAEAAELPDFESLRQRGKRRQAVRRAAVAGATALAVVAVIGAAQLASSNPTVAPIAPDPTVTPTPTPEPTDDAPIPGPTPDPKAAAIVDDPRAVMTDLQVDPGDADVMAALWECHEPECERRGAALALTGDGFAHRTVYRVQGGGLFEALGSGAFHYWWGLDSGVFRVPGVDAPSGGGGAVVSIGSGLHVWTLVTPEGGRLVENSEEFGQIVVSADGGLTALGYHDASGRVVVARSTDIGATWDRQRVEGGAPGPLFSIITSAGAPAMLETSDGLTYAPLAATLRLSDSGRWIRYAAPAGDTAYTAGQVVLPDGRLFTAVDDWAGDGQPGFYVSAGDDWSTMTRVSSPFPDDYRPVVLAVQASATSAVMVVADPQVGYVDEGHRTTDGGRTWESIALR